MTAGTIFHRTCTPLSTWFAAIWLVTSQKNGASAQNLHDMPGLGSYDDMEAVSAELAAALGISQGLAGSRLRYARAMCERLPKVAELFQAGEIDYRTLF